MSTTTRSALLLILVLVLSSCGITEQPHSVSIDVTNVPVATVFMPLILSPNATPSTTLPTPSTPAPTPSTTLPTPSTPAPTPSTTPPVNEFYVAPDGRAAANGSQNDPWDLATALLQPALVHPGATIWLRGGVYTGQFKSNLQGQADVPITLRQYPGEHATINGSLYIDGTWTWYWGFEVTNSPENNGVPVNAVSVFAPYTKLINLVVHDNRGSGIGLWKEAPGSEIYGCLIYNNGVSQFEHGIYVQNQGESHRIANNVLFYQSGFGIHGYTKQGQYLSGLNIVDNTIFNNGWSWPYASNILVGGETSTERISVTGNDTYYNSARLNVDIGYHETTNKDVSLSNNYFVGGQPVLSVHEWDQTTIVSNTLIGQGRLVAETAAYQRLAAQTWDGNNYTNTGSDAPFALNNTSLSFVAWQKASGGDTTATYTTNNPAAPRIVVRPNLYDQGRATLTVYNWSLQASIAFDLSKIVPPGSEYELHDVQNYFGDPIAAGRYDGGLFELPMTGLSVATPSGDWIPKALASDTLFHSFILTFHS